MSIAKTIANQLTVADNGINRLSIMTGAHNFIDQGNGLSFKFKMSKKFNYCKILLDKMDTYTVEFIKIWGSKTTREKTIEGVYADQLKSIFEDETGLYLKLF